MWDKQTKLMVLLYHWFIPYKVEGGKVSFQCGTSKNCQGVHELTKLMVLLYQWFIPYKVKGGKVSFQRGTSKNCQGVHEFP